MTHLGDYLQYFQPGWSGKGKIYERFLKDFENYEDSKTNKESPVKSSRSLFTSTAFIFISSSPQTHWSTGSQGPNAPLRVSTNTSNTFSLEHEEEFKTPNISQKYHVPRS